MSVLAEANLPHMGPIGCFPSNLGTYLGQATELGFEADPGCAPDPAPNNGDYYQITVLDGDSNICGHPVAVNDYMVWNNGGWFPMTPQQTASSFLALSDTPASYAGTANLDVVVAGTEDGLEFNDTAKTLYGGIMFSTWVDLRAYTGYFSGQMIHIKETSPIYHYKAEVTADADSGDAGEVIEPDDYTGFSPTDMKWRQQA